MNSHSWLAQSPRIDEILFDSNRKRMTTVHKIDNERYAYVKGAPDIIVNLCTKIIIKGKVRKLNKKDKENILKTNDEFSGNALRVLGFAYKELKKRKEILKKNYY